MDSKVLKLSPNRNIVFMKNSRGNWVGLEPVRGNKWSNKITSLSNWYDDDSIFIYCVVSDKEVPIMLELLSEYEKIREVLG